MGRHREKGWAEKGKEQSVRANAELVGIEKEVNWGRGKKRPCGVERYSSVRQSAGQVGMGKELLITLTGLDQKEVEYILSMFTAK